MPRVRSLYLRFGNRNNVAVIRLFEADKRTAISPHNDARAEVFPIICLKYFRIVVCIK